jgi:ubiquinone biosynthesis protein
MFALVRNSRRILAILVVLARHNLLNARLARLADPAVRSQPAGRRLAGAFQALGPSFIKFGQALSTRPDLVGEAVAAELSELQDRLPPFPAAQARQIIETELGQPVETLYASFAAEPVAAASIAQVHLAIAADGREVAVKILRPGVEERFADDVALFFWLAQLVSRLAPRLRRLRLSEAVKTFEETVAMEMDLRLEAAAAAEMAENFAGDDSVKIPGVDWQRTARRVLTLERVSGISVDEVEAIVAAGIDPEAVVKAAAAAYFNMVFRDGLFHADLHPGNLFVGPKGELILVDFGITGRVDRQTRRYLGEMLLGFLSGNYRRVAEIHFEAGFVPPDKSIDAFTQACRSIAEPIMGRPLHEISVARLLGQLFEITETFAMEAQPQLLLLQKSMLVVEGVGRRLAPRANMWELARPLIEGWMVAHLSPAAKMRDTVGTLAATLESLPRLVAHAEKTVEALRHGGLKLHPDSLRSIGRKNGGWVPVWLPWVLVAALTVLLLRR